MKECAACGEQIHAHHYPFWNRTLWSTTKSDQISCEVTNGYHDPWHPDDDDSQTDNDKETAT